MEPQRNKAFNQNLKLETPLLLDLLVWFIWGLVLMELMEPSSFGTGVIFFIVWVIAGKISLTIVDNIYRKINQSSFDEYLREGCLEMMEPTIGKNKDWVLNDFKKMFSSYRDDEFNINTKDVSCSMFMPHQNGILEIKCKPYFDSKDLCNDYDIWYYFYDQNGLPIPGGQHFSSRDRLLNKE